MTPEVSGLVYTMRTVLLSLPAYQLTEVHRHISHLLVRVQGLGYNVQQLPGLCLELMLICGTCQSIQQPQIYSLANLLNVKLTTSTESKPS